MRLRFIDTEYFYPTILAEERVSLFSSPNFRRPTIRLAVFHLSRYTLATPRRNSCNRTRRYPKGYIDGQGRTCSPEKMFGISCILNAAFRSPLHAIHNLRNFSANTQPLYFKASDALLGEPLKKKKRLDPAILRAREERKRKKLEKKIRFLEKRSDHLKPIFEVDASADSIRKEGRVPPTTTSLPEQVQEQRMQLQREWSRYKQEQWLKDSKVIRSIMLSQRMALEELRAASKQLYRQAIEFDDAYLPYDATGPVHTPPIANYDSPDGEYVETTVKYVGE